MNRTQSFFVTLVVLSLISGFAARPFQRVQAQSPISFNDISAQSNLTFKHDDGSRGSRLIMETLASGLAVFDYDLDGDDDIFFLSAVPTSEKASAKEGAGNQLFRNDGGNRFTNVTIAAGLKSNTFSLAVAAGDYDNDGWPDLFIGNYGPNVLMHNNGDGTFSDVTAMAGVATGSNVGAGVNFVDVNGDGNLDLFASNYVVFDPNNPKPTIVDGRPLYSSPKLFDAEGDKLFLNRGDGTFEDGSASSGIGTSLSTAMGTICLDYDEDGDTDILVLNDVRPNLLFQNDGKGKFEEVALIAGFAFNSEGNVLGSMGIDAVDFDHDGHIDIFQTAYTDEYPVLRQNLGGGLFDDATRSSKLSLHLYKEVEWGTCFADFDNDRYADLFVATGHLQDNLGGKDVNSSYEMANAVFRNNGRGGFENVTGTCGDALKIKRSSRGAAVSDFDGDGKIDVIVLNARSEPTLLHNESAGNNHWLELKLVGTKSNRDGIGARVHLWVGTDQQTMEVHSGRGYQSHWGTTLHFGLGEAKEADRIEIEWPSGIKQTLQKVAGDQKLKVVETSSK